jgi:hypothetical protein
MPPVQKSMAGEGPAYPGSSAGKPRSAAGEGPAFPGSSAGTPKVKAKPKYGIGVGVIDKRTVQQKLDDAGKRSVSRFDKKYKKIPKGSSVAGTKVDG